MKSFAEQAAGGQITGATPAGRPSRNLAQNQQEAYTAARAQGIDESTANDCQKDIKEIVDNLPKVLSEKWNINLNVPVVIEFSRGKSWMDLK